MSVTKYKLARNTKRSCVSCNSNSATDPKTSSDAKNQLVLNSINIIIIIFSSYHLQKRNLVIFLFLEWYKVQLMFQNVSCE